MIYAKAADNAVVEIAFQSKESVPVWIVVYTTVITAVITAINKPLTKSLLLRVRND